MDVKVTLLEDWKRILKKAWSIRLALIAAALSSVEITLPLFVDMVPRGIFAAMSALIAVLAVAARLFAQPKMRGKE